MVKDLSNLKSSFNGSPSDLLINVLVTMEKKDKRISFEKNRIDYLYEIESDTAGILMKNGTHIQVAMPLKQLERQIYFRSGLDGDVLDLCEKTGAGFYRRGMEITAMVRKAEHKNVYAEFTFFEGCANFGSVSQYDSGYSNCGYSVSLNIKGVKPPFGADEIIIDMTEQELLRRYKDAKAAGVTKLDLRQGEVPSKKYQTGKLEL